MAQSKQQWQYKFDSASAMPKYQIKKNPSGVEKIAITTVVHTIKMGDVEDPDLMVAFPMHEWEKSEEGKWIMEHSVETPSWHRSQDFNTWGYVYQIRAYLTPEDHTFWKLKYE